MCSELFRIPYELGGVPIFGIGVLLALWAIASVITIASLVRRHGWSGETWGSIPVLLMVGAAIVLLPKMFPEGLPIRGYGVMLLVGIVSGVGLAMVRARGAGLDSEVILSLGIWLVVCGVIGARLFYVIEYWNDKFAGKSARDTLLEILNVPEGGLVIYGGFIGAAIGGAIFLRKQKLPLLAMADLVAPSFMVGLAFGRIGCLLNGCCYGGQTDLPWALTFPQYSSRYEVESSTGEPRLSPPYADQAAHGEMHGFRLHSREPVSVAHVEPGSNAAAAGLKVGDVVVSIDGQPIVSADHANEIIMRDFLSQSELRMQTAAGRTIEIRPVEPPPRSLPVHPTQLYSAIDAGLLAWLLWAFYPFRRHEGQTFALMLTIHPITRFLLETIRTDEPAVFGTGLSISQNLSVLLLAAAAVLWWYSSRQPPGLAWPLATEPESSPPARANNRRTRT
jgi:phosphatidylglycerol---prolipoprotein diacylglyceryl transferase